MNIYIFMLLPIIILFFLFAQRKKEEPDEYLKNDVNKCFMTLFD